MKNYEMRIIPKYDCDGKIYWTAFFPAIDGCVGGGDTVEEAVKEAEENLEIFLDYLSSEKFEIPKEYSEPACNGKIALRLPKSLHQALLYKAMDEGVSLNSLLISAVSNYLGKSQFAYDLDERLNQFAKHQNILSLTQNYTSLFDKPTKYSFYSQESSVDENIYKGDDKSWRSLTASCI